MTQTQTQPTAIEIQDWMIHKIASLIGISPDEVNVQEDLELYGLDSVEAITLAGELSDWVRRDLSPNLVREHPTITDIARFITEGE